MEAWRPQLIVLADSTGALCTLFGIPLLERLLRMAQRLGFREALIVTDSGEVMDSLASPSWARAGVTLSFCRENWNSFKVGQIPGDVPRTMVVSAGFYY